MKELLINEKIREVVNEYLGYELIKPNEVGHHIFEEAPGQGKMGIEGAELNSVITTKFLDANGNIEWHKSANPNLHVGPHASKGELTDKGLDHYPQSFHCKLTTVSSKKAKILIASLFPEEIVDKKFLRRNREEIDSVRMQLELIQNLREMEGHQDIPETLHNKMETNDPMIMGAVTMMKEMEKKS